MINGHLSLKRNLQLIIAIICMVMIANMQYGWTLFVNPIQLKFGWDKAAIQVAFTIFVLSETWLVPIEGYLVDRFGPKIIVFFGGIFCGAGWCINSIAESLIILYLGAAVSGIGAGAVYGTCVGNALKWFPDKRGFAAGLTAAGFGAGSALTIIPITTMIATRGYEAAFFYFGIIQGLTILVLSFFMVAPSKEVVLPPARASTPQVKRDFTPREMLKTPLFWLMYAMFTMMAAGGLMATAQLAIVARDFQVADVPITLMGITLPALSFALSFDRILNGITRPFFGWISDRIGRELTMTIAFTIEAAGILAMYYFGQDPLLFILLTGLVFFAWGEIYSLFPSTCTDTYGQKYATTNAGLLYTAKGTASVLVPLSSVIAAWGGLKFVFFLVCALDLTAALLAWFVLRPLRRKFIDHHNNIVDANKEQR